MEDQEPRSHVAQAKLLSVRCRRKEEDSCKVAELTAEILGVGFRAVKRIRSEVSVHRIK